MTESRSRSLVWDVRPATVPQDSEGIVQVSNLYDSEPLSVEEFERLWHSWPAEDPRSRMVATDGSGAIVGTAHCRRRASMTPGLFLLQLSVSPTASRQGIGTELLRLSENFALAHGAKRITAFVPDEFPTGRPYMENRGYKETRRLFESVLEIASVPESRVDAAVGLAFDDGMQWTTLAALGDTEVNRRRLYDVTAECDLDEPATIEFGGVSWEDYQRTVFQAPWFRPDCVIVALSGDQWAGVHVIGPMEDSPIADIATDFTGVRRPFRGRGLATALKLLGVRKAREIGGTNIMTHNDSTNAPMLAVNQKLGFVARSGLLFMTKEFDL